MSDAMLSFDDFSGSASAAMSTAMQLSTQQKSGSQVRQLGSGTLNAKLYDSAAMDPSATSDAKATSAQSKTGDGGNASATSMLTDGASTATAATTTGGIPPWALYAALGLGALWLLLKTVQTMRKN